MLDFVLEFEGLLKRWLDSAKMNLVQIGEKARTATPANLCWRLSLLPKRYVLPGRESMVNLNLRVVLVLLFSWCLGCDNRSSPSTAQESRQPTARDSDNEVNNELNLVGGDAPASLTRTVGLVLGHDGASLCSGALIAPRIFITSSLCDQEYSHVFLGVSNVVELLADLRLALPWWKNPANPGIRDAKIIAMHGESTSDGENFLPDLSAAILDAAPRPRDPATGNYQAIPASDPNQPMKLLSVEGSFYPYLSGYQPAAQASNSTPSDVAGKVLSFAGYSFKKLVDGKLVPTFGIQETPIQLSPNQACVRTIERLMNFEDDGYTALTNFENDNSYCSVATATLSRKSMSGSREKVNDLIEYKLADQRIARTWGWWVSAIGGPLFWRGAKGDLWLVGISVRMHGEGEAFPGGYVNRYAKVGSSWVQEWLKTNIYEQYGKELVLPTTGVPADWHTEKTFLAQRPQTDQDVCGLFTGSSRNACRNFNAKNDPMSPCVWNVDTWKCSTYNGKDDICPIFTLRRESRQCDSFLDGKTCLWVGDGLFGFCTNCANNNIECICPKIKDENECLAFQGGNVCHLVRYAGCQAMSVE